MNEIEWKKVLPYAGLPVLLIALWWLRGQQMDRAKLLLWECLVLFGYLAAYCDGREKRVPNRLILWMLSVWVLILVPQLFVRTEQAISLLLSSIAGFLLGGGVFLLVYLFSRGGLGGGDVKLMAAAGLYLGYLDVLPAMLYGSVLAALAGGILILWKKIGRKDAIPLVPFLYVGILLTMFIR